MLRIGIVGGGVVGRATARCFMEHAEVRVYDTNPSLSTHRILETVSCDLVFVCLPTPQKDGALGCDTSFVEGFFRETAADERERSRNFVLRSTVPVGTTRRLSEKYGLPNLVHSPEFLTARCALTDAMIPARNIIGAPVLPTVNTIDGCYDALWELYEKRFPGVQIIGMTSDESELVKLGLNSFFATKVAYFNELRAYADRMGLDWERVHEGILSDGRIAHAHTQVPGPDGKWGFGGTCLPKDLANLVDAIGADAHVTLGAHYRNLEDRQK